MTSTPNGPGDCSSVNGYRVHEQRVARSTVMGGAPVTASPSSGLAVTAICPARPGPSGHILLAEDNPVNRMVATAMLERLGFHVDVAMDGAEAVEAARGTRCRAILMDCQMPVLDGYEATRQIRRLQMDARRTPIIAVTASAMKSDPQRCLAAGMDDFLPKPFSLEALAAMLDRWAPDLERVGAGRTTAATTPPPS